MLRQGKVEDHLSQICKLFNLFVWEIEDYIHTPSKRILKKELRGLGSKGKVPRQKGTEIYIIYLTYINVKNCMICNIVIILSF